MNRIVNILKTYIPRDSPKLLGRWNIDYCNKKINNKIDLSNEDHCGPCGQYAMTKLVNEVNIHNTPVYISTMQEANRINVHKTGSQTISEK